MLVSGERGGSRPVSISVRDITTPKAEWFYWLTILFSKHARHRPLGDFLADNIGTRLRGRAPLVFGAMLALIALAYFFLQILAYAAVLGGVHPHTQARSERRSATF